MLKSVFRRAPSRPQSRRRRAVVLVAKTAALLIAASFLMTLALRWIPAFTTTVILERRIEALAARRAYPVRHQWVSWDRISPQAALAVIAAEDQRFAEHHGFDIDSIEKAIDEHERGRRLRGASTISQQVAKNLFLWPGRSFVRKGFEAYFTVLIECTWSKRRILEVYLNSVELGNGVFGVEAASRRYFRKPASRLDRNEAALLAAVLPNPRLMRVERPSAYVLERRDWILQQMAQLGGTPYVRQF